MLGTFAGIDEIFFMLFFLLVFTRKESIFKIFPQHQGGKTKILGSQPK